MEFFIAASYGLLLTAGLVFLLVTIGRYGLYLIDKFEYWVKDEDSTVDSTNEKL